MCGIFGSIADEVRQHVINELALACSARGDRGFGAFIQGEGMQQVARFCEPYNALKITTQGATVALFHSRAPTGTQSSTWRHIHPFESRNFLVAHNGLLFNHDTFAQLNGWKPFEVDSMVIPKLLEHCILSNPEGGAPAAARYAAGSLEGQQACWAWSKPEQRLYLWRVMSPIFVGYHKDSFNFASVQTYSTPDGLEEGKIYRYEGDGNLGVVGEFAFTTPYAEV